MKVTASLSIPPHYWTSRSFTVAVCASATRLRSRSDFHPSQPHPWGTDPQMISEITETAEKAPSLSLCAPVFPFVEEDHASVALQNHYEQVYNAIGGEHTDTAKHDTDQAKGYLQESSLTADTAQHWCSQDSRLYFIRQVCSRLPEFYLAVQVTALYAAKLLLPHREQVSQGNFLQFADRQVPGKESETLWYYRGSRPGFVEVRGLHT